MKKILVAIALVMTMSVGAKAQIGLGLTDGFFNDWEGMGTEMLRTDPLLPGLPFMHGMFDDVQAPLGSGLFILGALGAGYAVARRKREK